MQKLAFLLSIIAASIHISSCSGIKFPGVYRVSVQQGNYLQQSKLDELEVGMTKTQVQYVLGTPLIKDSFDQGRWDYYFAVKRGEKVFQKKKFTVFFDNDNILSKWEGDIKPRTAEELAEIEAKRKTAKINNKKKVDENVLTKNNIDSTNKEVATPEDIAKKALKDARKENTPKKVK